MNGTCTVTFCVLTRISGTCSNRDDSASNGLFMTDHRSLTSHLLNGNQSLFSPCVFVTRFLSTCQAGDLSFGSELLLQAAHHGFL